MNTQFDVDRVAVEWQFEIDQVAASMSMRLSIEGTAAEWCALLFAFFTSVAGCSCTH
jgi:hypothetical protein